MFPNLVRLTDQAVHLLVWHHLFHAQLFLQFQQHDHKRQGNSRQVFQGQHGQHKHGRPACIQQTAPETRFQEGYCHASTREEDFAGCNSVGTFSISIWILSSGKEGKP